jgi:acetyl-CoA carboxylase beta subunit
MKCPNCCRGMYLVDVRQKIYVCYACHIEAQPDEYFESNNEEDEDDQ